MAANDNLFTDADEDTAAVTHVIDNDNRTLSVWGTWGGARLVVELLVRSTGGNVHKQIYAFLGSDTVQLDVDTGFTIRLDIEGGDDTTSLNAGIGVPS